MTGKDSESKVEWELMKSWKTTACEKQFWVAVNIFVERSHIINRRLVGSELFSEIPIKSTNHICEIIHHVLNCKTERDIQELIKKEKDVLSCSVNHKQVALLKKVLPKSKSIQPSFEVVFKEYNENIVSFFTSKQENSAVPYFPYAFSFNDGSLNLLVEKGVADSDPSVRWLGAKVIPKLVKWMENFSDTEPKNTGSLCLVSVTEYSILYNNLKENYGKKLVQMWPENTDPLKFVYEDIGIATYLLLLWAGKPKQRFVDLGCGNGLLVHILNSEGHLGVGYDIRARKIWDLYPPSTKLEVHTVVPSPETIFPDADWLIGNHSDELTVWIPVMAARNSFSCNFFLLPCCPYEFDGKKYCRVNTCVSQYSDFLNYVETVCGKCGFFTERDKLRIPSTKRICFVSQGRTYSKESWKEKVENIQAFVDSKCTFQCDSGEATCQFKPRIEEKVRNCTKINSDIRETIVNLVAEQLLAKKRLSEQSWNYGGVVELNYLAKIIPQETLKNLKKECGGLQTLLKNHHNIFKVQSGKVEFRTPTHKVETDSVVWKTKPCWFYHNHPNKCPLPEEHCSFIHDAH